MNKFFLKAVTVMLIAAFFLGLLSGCGKQTAADTEAIVNAAVKAAMDASNEPVSVTIIVDDKYITIEDAAGLSLQQLLERAKITLNEGDVLSFDTAQVVGNNISVKVLRLCHVTVTVTNKFPMPSTSYQVVLAGGTVADALTSVGITLKEGQFANYELTDALVDDMEIIVSDTAIAQTPTEPTLPIEAFITQEEPSEEDFPDDTSPEPTERHEVSRDIYYDCDDSGHGVIVITYSDGTQEEVYF